MDSNSTLALCICGSKNRSAAAKREDRRAERRADRNNRCRNCHDPDYLEEELGLFPQEANLVSEFYRLFEEEEIDFIADFLMDGP